MLLNERLFTKASLRVMLSDFANDITTLPGVTATAPVQLDGAWRAAPPNNGNPYGPVDATHSPIARLGGIGDGTDHRRRHRRHQQSPDRCGPGGLQDSRHAGRHEGRRAIWT